MQEFYIYSVNNQSIILPQTKNNFAVVLSSSQKYLITNCNNYVIIAFEHGLVPKEKFENEKVVQIACGGAHVLFLTENNNLFGAGNSFCGSLSIDNAYDSNTDIVKCDTSTIGEQKIKEIDVSYNFSFILTVDGDLFATGSCTFAGYFFVALKTFENKYFIFGYNNFNQFGEVDSGLTASKIYGTNTKLTSFNVNDIDQLQCGGPYHSMIVNKNQDIYISGNGFDNSIINGNHKGYTKIEMTKVIKNWQDCKRDFNFKLETGYNFILIYSERKRTYFNFKNAYKIADNTRQF